MRIILDDFGAGHASIAYLRYYTFDGLKIDRSFTASLETDPRSRAFVSAIIAMANALGIEAIAEGVETPGQLRLLRRQRIAAVQGYLLGRPMTPEAAADLVIQTQGHRRKLLARDCVKDCEAAAGPGQNIAEEIESAAV